MKISGSTPVPPQVATRARATRDPETDAPATAPEPEALAESAKRHGLVRAAEHSHRSDVAALRQWINHANLRSDLSLPDISTEHKGNGFARAVAAYEVAIATATQPPVTDPLPVVTDPAPVLEDPDPEPLLDVLLPESTSADDG